MQEHATIGYGDEEVIGEAINLERVYDAYPEAEDRGAIPETALKNPQAQGHWTSVLQAQGVYTPRSLDLCATSTRGLHPK
eukprot:5686563-Amphidinium_carterae.1